MARIRSLHPGQWTDEDFVECSAFARLLSLGLRNEADDNGVFEWKPVSLKMRLFPADSIDMKKLLQELVSNNQIMRFEMDGRAYGAIRNFRVWQSPKSPTAQFPISDTAREYVGISENYDSRAKKGPGRPRKNESEENQSDSAYGIPQKVEINPDGDNYFPQTMENNSQRERRGEDNIINKPSTTDSARNEKSEKRKRKPDHDSRNDPGPNPKFVAFTNAAGMSIFPSDLGNLLKKWDDAGISFDSEVLVAVREAAKRMKKSGFTPRTASVFDQDVMELDAANRAENERIKAIPDQIAEADREQRNRAIAEAREALDRADENESRADGSPGKAPPEVLAQRRKDANAALAAFGVERLETAV